MNVFFDAPRLQNALKRHRLPALIRSPLAMGLLSGKYDSTSQMNADDIRANALLDWADYYVAGKPNPAYLARLEAIRGLLTTGGRSLVQGAISWLWAKGDNNIPLPGIRTVDQLEGIAGALAFGPLPEDVMAEIETLIPREPADAPDRER